MHASKEVVYSEVGHQYGLPFKAIFCCKDMIYYENAAKITKTFQLLLCPAILFANFPWINKRYERKFGYLNYFTYLRAAFLKKPRSLLC